MATRIGLRVLTKPYRPAPTPVCSHVSRHVSCRTEVLDVMRLSHRRVRRSEWCFLCSAERWNCVRVQREEAPGDRRQRPAELQSEVYDGSVTGNKSWRKAIPVSLPFGITASLWMFGCWCRWEGLGRKEGQVGRSSEGTKAVGIGALRWTDRREEGMVCHQEGAQDGRTALHETSFLRGKGFWIFALPSFQCLPR